MENKQINKGKRSVLLFIPMLNDCKNYSERKKVSLLRRSVNFSVNQVSDILNNRLFEEFSKLNKFIYERGLPQIQLHTAEHINITKESNIRICLTKFNDIDFFSKENITAKMVDTNNISHLIELQIKENSQKITWKKSTRVDIEGKQVFDVTVTTPLSLLYKVILSVMIDIYCYYIIGLSCEYENRRSFSRKKVQYLTQSCSRNKIKKRYNINDISNNIDYLKYHC